MTINGVKKLLNNKEYNVDETNNLSINAKNVKYRLNKISNIIKSLKK